MTTDLNDRIALAKGWTVKIRPGIDPYTGQQVIWKGVPVERHDWRNPDGQYQGHCPLNFTGTLEGMAGMMRELNERAVKAGNLWDWQWHPWQRCYRIRLIEIATGQLIHRGFDSRDDHPGDCVGEAYISVFGKDKDDPKMP